MESAIPASASLAELLLHELTHRINNELAALIAIVSLEQATNRDERTLRALTRVHTRLINVGRLQHALQLPGDGVELDAADYLRRLCECVQRATLEDVHVRFDGRSVKLDAERCRRLGMIVSELIGNARKHAFKGAHGSVMVTLNRFAGKICCRVADTGCGYSGTSIGRGLTIVHALANSLGGCLSHEPTGKGTTWLLTLPG